MEVIVFDIETTGLKVEEGAIFTCASTYSFPSGEHKLYTQSQLPELVKALKGADVVSGFNIVWFDLPFVEKVSGLSLDGVKVYDIYETVKANRVSGHGNNTLDAIWKLNCPGLQGKLADGLAAIKYWNEGNVRDLHEYVMQDAKVEAFLAYALSTNGLLMPNGNKVHSPMLDRTGVVLDWAVSTYTSTIIRVSSLPAASKDVVKRVKPEATPAQVAGIVAAAVKSGFPLRFKYIDNKGEVTERVAERLQWYKDEEGNVDELKVVGQCRLRGAERHFNIQQMSHPCLTK